MLGDIIQRTIRLGCCVIRHTCKGREGQDKKAESKRAAAQIKPEETRRKGGFLCDGIRRVFLHECPIRLLELLHVIYFGYCTQMN